MFNPEKLKNLSDKEFREIIEKEFLLVEGNAKECEVTIMHDYVRFHDTAWSNGLQNHIYCDVTVPILQAKALFEAILKSPVCQDSHIQKYYYQRDRKRWLINDDETKTITVI